MEVNGSSFVPNPSTFEILFMVPGIVVSARPVIDGLILIVYQTQFAKSWTAKYQSWFLKRKEKELNWQICRRNPVQFLQKRKTASKLSLFLIKLRSWIVERNWLWQWRSKGQYSPMEQPRITCILLQLEKRGRAENVHGLIAKGIKAPVSLSRVTPH